ncbi:hypothetical protein FDUTEX481_01098 [Tolypothrix sp. PCC 7601]|nr:hypothetical protein FDUTEX481_01098 [Tolypothrix sp. PCC 7601]
MHQGVNKANILIGYSFGELTKYPKVNSIPFAKVIFTKGRQRKKGMYKIFPLLLFPTSARRNIRYIVFLTCAIFGEFSRLHSSLWFLRNVKH